MSQGAHPSADALNQSVNMSSPTSDLEEPEDTKEEPTWWAVIFRREVDSWTQLSFSEEEEESSSFSHQFNDDDFSPVIPQEGCIVLPELRQKWTLKNENHTGTMIRRGDKLLLRSHGTIRILMLQFASLDECLTFCDRFAELNPPAALADNDGTNTTAMVVEASPEKGSDTVEQKQQQQNANQDDQNQLQQPSTQQLVVNGMVTRLLHDKDFLRFVYKIEQYIDSTSDGAKMLEGLQGRDLSGL